MKDTYQEYEEVTQKYCEAERKYHKAVDEYREAVKKYTLPISVLDKIRAEIVEMRSKQNCSCADCLDIIDKYKAESEV